MRRLLAVLLILSVLASPALGAKARRSRRPQRITDAQFLKLCEEGDQQKILDAIKKGANVNAKDNDGWTPLILAAYFNKNPEVINLLIDAGADDATDKSGKMAIDYARNNPRLKGSDALKRLEELSK